MVTEPSKMMLAKMALAKNRIRSKFTNVHYFLHIFADPALLVCQTAL